MSPRLLLLVPKRDPQSLLISLICLHALSHLHRVLGVVRHSGTRLLPPHLPDPSQGEDLIRVRRLVTSGTRVKTQKLRLFLVSVLIRQERTGVAGNLTAKNSLNLPKCRDTGS